MAALSLAIQQSANRLNRERQQRAELRLEELIKVEGIADDYSIADRRGDLAMERRFATLYATVDTEAEKEAVAAAFATWMKTERDEEASVLQSVSDSTSMMKDHNPVFIDGAWTPRESDGAA